MESNRNWAKGILIILSDRKYRLFFAAACAIFFTLYLFGWNIVLLRALYFRSDLWTLPNIVLLIATTLFSALAATLSAFTLKTNTEYHRQKYGYIAALPALLASACPSCAPLIFSFSGATFAIGMTLAKYGTQIRIAALLILAIVVVQQSSSIGACKLKQKMAL